ncbi:MAG: hypothetical protein QOE90_2321 [Thermoplasmata archaeon]|jgi:hypothetical protein|nr:hypothetical protein [Thermoplasmata archaeon]
MVAHRRSARVLALGLVLVALAPLALGALPSVGSTPGLELSLVANARVPANVSLAAWGAYDLRPAAAPLGVPLQSQTITLSLDGRDVATATTDGQGRYALQLPPVAEAGHHALLARADALGETVARSQVLDVLVVLPPAAPQNVTGGPGPHTGDAWLRWAAPPADEARPVDSYLVERMAADGTVSRVARVNGFVHAASDTQTPGVAISYRVTGVNLAGAGASSPWIAVTPALPPAADALALAARSVDVCHAGACVNVAPYDIAFVGGDNLPVTLRVHAAGRLTNLGAAVPGEPWNGTALDNSTDLLTWPHFASSPFAGRTASDGGFGVLTPPIEVPNVRANQTCLQEILTVGAHYPGVYVPPDVPAPDLTATDTTVVYLC